MAVVVDHSAAENAKQERAVVGAGADSFHKTAVVEDSLRIHHDY